MIGKLANHYRKVAGSMVVGGTGSATASQVAKQAEIRVLADELRMRHPNSVALKGYKVYSQNDEDGIIAAIFEVIGGGGTYLEIGVEDGRECNTHFLAVQGWRGMWVEPDPASAQAIEEGLGRRAFPGKFRLIQDFANVENIAAIYRDACKLCAVDELDFFSLDIDGNDLYVMRCLLGSGARPTAICVEYNGKFPPPARVSVSHDSSRAWAKDDYFGASLQAFYDALSAADYGLVACNISGTNAFFVLHDKLSSLEQYTPIQAWQPLRPHLTVLPSAHMPTLKFMRDALGG